MCNTICNKCLRVCHVDIDEREYIKRNQSHIRCARPIQLKDKDVCGIIIIILDEIVMPSNQSNICGNARAPSNICEAVCFLHLVCNHTKQRCEQPTENADFFLFADEIG